MRAVMAMPKATSASYFSLSLSSSQLRAAKENRELTEGIWPRRFLIKLYQNDASEERDVGGGGGRGRGGRGWRRQQQ